MKVYHFSAVYLVGHFKIDSLIFCINNLSHSTHSGSDTPFDKISDCCSCSDSCCSGSGSSPSSSGKVYMGGKETGCTKFLNSWIQGRKAEVQNESKE